MFKIKIKNEDRENEYYVFAEHELHIIGHAVLPIVAVPNFYELSIVSGNKTNIKQPLNIDITVKKETNKDEPKTMYESNGNSINVSSDLTFIYTNSVPVIATKDSIEHIETLNLATEILPLTLEEYETLYELHLEDIKENPSSEFSKLQSIKQDVDHAKTLIKCKKERK